MVNIRRVVRKIKQFNKESLYFRLSWGFVFMVFIVWAPAVFLGEVFINQTAKSLRALPYATTPAFTDYDWPHAIGIFVVGYALLWLIFFLYQAWDYYVTRCDEEQ